MALADGHVSPDEAVAEPAQHDVWPVRYGDTTCSTENRLGPDA